MYPFGIVGGPNGPVAGPPDDIGRIGQALKELAGGGPPLPVRMYVTYEGDVDAALGQAAQFAQIGRLVDLSLNFHDPAGDVPRWRTFVDAVVRRHGAQVGSIGVTNEANLRNVPFAPDGAYPNAWEALVGGVLAAAVPIRVNECGWPTGPGRRRGRPGPRADRNHPDRGRSAQRFQRHALGALLAARRRQ